MIQIIALLIALLNVALLYGTVYCIKLLIKKHRIKRDGIDKYNYRKAV